MAEELEQQVGLSGEEVIRDVVDQISRKLRRDCNLRGSDSYDYGYSGTISIRLKLYGLDDVSSDHSVEVKGGHIQGEPIEEADSEVTIEREPDLDVVRERSNQPEPTVEATKEEPQARQKRKYTRHITAPHEAIGGGSEGVLSE